MLGASGLPAGLTLTDNGDGTGEITGTIAVGEAANSPFTVTITATDDLDRTSRRVFEFTVSLTGYVAEVVADSPIGYWRLGESSGTTATDRTGTHHGTYVGSPTLGVAGVIPDGDTAVDFDGSNDYVEVPDHADFDLQQLTVEAWAKKGSKNGVFFAGHTSTTGGTGYNWGLYESTGGWYMFVKIGGTAYNAEIPDAQISATEWHHVVGTYDGSTIRVYLDGAEVDTTAQSGTVDTGGANFYMGGRWSSKYFSGALDEVAVYGTALSPARIAAHYNAGKTPEARFTSVAHTVFDLDEEGFADSTAIATLTDQTGNGNDATQATAGSRPVAQTNGGVKVARFLTDDYINTGSFSPLTEPSTHIVLFQSDDADTGTHHIVDGNVSTQRHLIRVDGGNLALFAGTAVENIATEDANWHVLVVVVNSGSTKAYLDGGSDLSTTNIGSNQIGSVSLGAYGQTPSNTYFDGDIAYYGLYDGDLHTDNLALLNDLGQALADRVGITWTDMS